MAKGMALVALLLGIGSLFVPWHEASVAGISATQGPLAGDVKEIKLLIFESPALLGALLGVLFGLKRFGRGLGIAVFIFGLLGLGMWAITNSAIAEHQQTVKIGMHLFLGCAALTTIGGLVGIIKPQRKQDV